MQINNKYLQINVDETSNKIYNLYSVEYQKNLIKKGLIFSLNINGINILQSLVPSIICQNNVLIVYYQNIIKFSVKLKAKKLLINYELIDKKYQLGTVNVFFSLNNSYDKWTTFKTKNKKFYLKNELLGLRKKVSLYETDFRFLKASKFDYCNLYLTNQIDLLFYTNKLKNKGTLVELDFSIIEQKQKTKKIVTNSFLCFFAFATIFLCNQPMLKYQFIYNYMYQLYDGEMPSQDEIDEKILSGIANSTGNPYTRYLTQDQFNAFTNDGSVFGFGYDILDGALTITHVLPGSSAENQLYPGDQLEKINNTSLQGKTLVDIKKLVDDNSSISIEGYRPSLQESFSISIKKQEVPEIKIMSNEFTINENGKEVKYGYIKIPEFSGDVDKQFKNKISDYKLNNIDKLIIDVCDNPGGDVEICQNILNQLVKKDKLLFSYTKDGKVDESFYSEGPGFNNEIIVLQNENSASASEILASALRYSADAKIVGQKSFGKGSGQRVFKLLFFPGYLKVTAFHWLQANNESIDGIGIEPDIALDKPYLSFDQLILTDPINLNDEGENIQTINQLLEILNYDVDPNASVCSEQTMKAMQSFCEQNQLNFNNQINAIQVYKLINEAQKQYNNPETNYYINQALGA